MYFFKPQTYTAELFTSSIRCGLLLQPPSAKCHMTNEFPPPQKCIYHFTKLLCRRGAFFPPLTLKHSWFDTEKWLQLSRCADGSNFTQPLLAWFASCSIRCPLITGWCTMASWGARKDHWKHPVRLGDKQEKKCSPQQDPAERQLVRGWDT